MLENTIAAIGLRERPATSLFRAPHWHAGFAPKAAD
jgi:hypothetical protein